MMDFNETLIKVSPDVPLQLIGVSLIQDGRHSLWTLADTESAVSFIDAELKFGVRFILNMCLISNIYVIS